MNTGTSTRERAIVHAYGLVRSLMIIRDQGKLVIVVVFYNLIVRLLYVVVVIFEF